MENYYLKRKTVRLLFLLMSLISAMPVLAQSNATGIAKVQEGIVSGTITDNFGKPLKGAIIKAKGARSTATTNTEGSFSIDAPQSGVLIISSKGFYDTELKVNSGQKVNVRMAVSYLQQSEDIALLNKDQDRASLLQSTSTIYTNQLTTTPAPSFLQALPGRLSGLYTRQRSGVQDTDDPETLMDFRIRGQNPTILIDGVPRDMSSIEPESIESISVLKDALSTVMYGQRSSNNMIYVTTKRPQASPFKLSATFQSGSESLINLPKTVSAADYAILYNEALNNDGLAPVYSAADIIAYRNGSDPYGHPNNNWQDLFLNKSTAISRFNLNMQSGNETARFYVALDYQNEGGFFKTTDINPYNTNSNVDRYIIRSNVSVDLNKTLNVALNIFGRIQNSNQPGQGNSTVFSNIFSTPNNAYPVFNADTSLAGTSKYINNISGLINNSGYQRGTSRDLSGDIAVTQKLDAILSGMWIRANVSYNNTVDQTVDRSKDFAVYNLPFGSSTYQQIGTNVAQRSSFAFNSRRTYTYNKLNLGYDKNFGDNNLNVLLLADRQATTLNLTLPAIYTNYASNITYNYKEKYFAEGAVSYGGFNRYKPGNRFGLFYAGGLGWNLAKEDFLSNTAWINVLKPRVSYGRTGNANVGYYIYDQYYDTSSSAVYYFGANGSGTAAKGYAELALANPYATWEKADKLNIGLDAELFSNRLKLTSEYFNDTYFDLMQTRGTSSQLIGQGYPAENIGKNRYTGVENSVSWNSKAGNFNYFIAGNASILQSKVLYQDEVTRDFDYQKRTGLPVSQTFGYIAEGFYESQAEINNGPLITGNASVPGDLKYKDLNDDGVIDQFDETAIGTQKPLIYYGLTTGFTVKGFDLSVSFQGVANRDIILTGDQEYEFQGIGDGQAFEHHLNRWTPNNAANATYPRLSVGTNANNQHASTFWLRSADYLRLQNVDFGYTLPVSVTRKFKVNSIRVFANGFNLYSFSGLDHNDAENNNSVYPLRRTFNAGLNIKL